MSSQKSESKKTYAKRIENKIFKYNTSATTTSQKLKPIKIPPVTNKDIIRAIKQYDEKNFIKLNNTQKVELTRHLDKLRRGDLEGAIELFDSILKMLDKKSGADLIVRALESITPQIDFTPSDRELFKRLYQLVDRYALFIINPEDEYKLGFVVGFCKDYLNIKFAKVESLQGAKLEALVELNLISSLAKILSRTEMEVYAQTYVNEVDNIIEKDFRGNVRSKVYSQLNNFRKKFVNMLNEKNPKDIQSLIKISDAALGNLMQEIAETKSYQFTHGGIGKKLNDTKNSFFKSEQHMSTRKALEEFMKLIAKLNDKYLDKPKNDSRIPKQ